MNIETLQARLRQLEDEKIKLVSIYDGAIQDCNYWITQLTPPKAEEVTE